MGPKTPLPTHVKESVEVVLAAQVPEGAVSTALEHEYLKVPVELEVKPEPQTTLHDAPLASEPPAVHAGVTALVAVRPVGKVAGSVHAEATAAESV